MKVRTCYIFGMERLIKLREAPFWNIWGKCRELDLYTFLTINDIVYMNILRRYAERK